VGQTIAIIETEGGEMAAVVKSARKEAIQYQMPKRRHKDRCSPVDLRSDKFFSPFLEILLQQRGICH
jgi:hypothetical protein